MKFDDLDKKMRVYEKSTDHCVLPRIWIVIRLDGRGFTTLTKKVMDYKRPFDSRFRDAMAATTKHVMSAGFNCVYGYFQSDEISILLSQDDTTFNRKTRKINSVAAGEASAAFTNEIGRVAAFDCRVSQLPTDELVVDYFRWRQQDAARNSLNGYCYYTLRDNGFSKRTATSQLLHMSVSDKNQMLFEHGINYNDLPGWEKNGVGVNWEQYEKVGYNPVANKECLSTRRTLTCDYELPYGEAYSDYIRVKLAGEVLQPNPG